MYLSRPVNRRRVGIMYNLGWFETKGGKVSIKVDKEISYDEFSCIEKNSEILSFVNLNYSYYEMLMKNFDEVLSVIKVFEQKRDEFTYDVEMLPYIKELNRTFINALGSFLCFINHYEYILKEKFVGNEIYDRFKSICNDYFDNYFEYRFCYKLRNYVVHCNIPVTLIQSTKEVIKDTFYIDIKELLRAFNWGKKVKVDLEKLNSNIEVKELVISTRNMLAKLNRDIILLDYKRILDALNYLEGYVRISGNREVQMPIIIINDNSDFEKAEIKSFGNHFFATNEIISKFVENRL